MSPPIPAAPDNSGLHSVSRDGFAVYYRVYGGGEPILILAGGPGFDCDYMEPLARELAKTHQTILVELRGTGRSLPPAIARDTLTVALTLGDLEAIREQMNLDRWTVAGHSAGAMLAIAYAIAYPERITSLLLMNSGPIRYASAGIEMENIMRKLTPREREALEKAGHDDFGRALDIILPAYFCDRTQTALVAPQLRPEKYHREAARLIASDIMPPGSDLRPGLERFARPAMVIAGSDDPLDATVQNEIHAALQNSTLHLIDRCGHFPWIEQPEEFYRSIRDFLSPQ